ncbi:MAG: hypothetical protein OXM55_02575 [Bdellovibrionales bacterium]|nr:hypothetical protein [Bdellovibrionales bacterium]
MAVHKTNIQDILKIVLYTICFSLSINSVARTNKNITSETKSTKSSYYGEGSYEQCNCINNKFTKHLTDPYKKEIEEWFIQTASPEDQTTEAKTICIDCTLDPLTKEEESQWGLFFQGIKKWYEKLQNIWNPKETPSPKTTPLQTREKKPDFIPSVCFQMSGQMVNDKPDSQEDFFTCIHKHYDGSDSDHLCADIINSSDYPKKCIAIPIPCEDTNNPDIPCKEKFRKRENNKKANGCNKGATFPRRPCLNEDYTAMTAKAFHDVAKCLNVPLDLAFPILHHESHFILNNESNTGALCYSQVTSHAVADFNSFLTDTPNYSSISDLLPKNIKAKCPEQWKHFQKINTKYTYNKKKQKILEIKTDLDRCRLNLNPYTCLFYGLSYIKILMHKAEQALQQMNQVEIVEIAGTTLILWDEEHKKKWTESNTNKNLQTRKIKIFSDTDLIKRWLTIIGYNGGISIPGSMFTGFMNDIKAQLAQTNNRKKRKQLLRTGLNISDFKNSFPPYVRKHYPQKGTARRSQVANYMGKVNRDMNTLQNRIQGQYAASLPKDICTPPWK